MGCIPSKPANVRSENQHDSSIVPNQPSNVNSTIMLEGYSEAYALAANLVQDHSKVKALASLRGDDAQKMVLRSQATDDIRKDFLHALSKLVRAALVFPASLKLREPDDYRTSQWETPQVVRTGELRVIRLNGPLKGSLEPACVKIIYKSEQMFPNDPTTLIRVRAKEAILRAYFQMQHPTILPLYGVDLLSEGGSVTELRNFSAWMENGNLCDYLDRNPPEAKSSQFKFMVDIVSGLDFLHRNEIIHGDLKSKNVHLSRQLRAVLADFEVARIDRENPTLSGIGVGDASWTAPEVLVVDSATPTKASDVWSFACTSYEIMTLQEPFYEVENVMKLIKIFETAREGGQKRIPKEPSSMNQDEKNVWTSVMKKCWEYTPEKRPQTGKILSIFSSLGFSVNTARLAELPDSTVFSGADAGVNYKDVKKILERIQQEQATGTTEGQS
ncbi:hypothetical protein NP233_g8160 [Leucocoprinus birnbaumii]|uniref:Protein kinase domain-containing protein n=1 Tax=Leucocoprinus birnbaumii TaxID=56174 RepID=A0AAD5VMU6_9AGAR|nr:hypothetical protein NP233_g8160 [Leucocoprinus birnbaumii]